MGFLVLDELNDSKGNYAFLDQIQALKWVQDNIHKFGGNKNLVSLMLILFCLFASDDSSLLSPTPIS
jgi:hypothetical protein